MAAAAIALRSFAVLFGRARRGLDHRFDQAAGPVWRAPAGPPIAAPQADARGRAELGLPMLESAATPYPIESAEAFSS